MEYKIFGPGGTPSEDFRRDVGDLLKLDDIQRNVLAEWFLTSKDYDFSVIPEGIAASTLLPEQFQRAASAVRSLLVVWQGYGLQLADVERDLLLMGFASKQLPVIVSLLGRLSPIKGRVWANDQLRMHAYDGLPTMDALNFVCEARAVFGGYPIDLTDSPYKQFLGVIPMVLMEIVTSDNYGNKQRFAFQLSEEQFERLQRTVGRAHEQFSILKEQTAGVAFGSRLP